MCYHYSLTTKALRTENRYGFIEDYTAIKDYDNFYHINGFQFPNVPVIANDRPEKIQLFQWGLVPGWTKNSSQAEIIRTQTLNARLDTIYEKPAYRVAAKAGNRCLIPADGIFEWQTIGKKKFPYFISFRDKQIFSIAGIWDEWHDHETGEIIKSFSMVTTEANPLLARIHNVGQRMPIILSKETETIWLNENLTKVEVIALGVPLSDEGMQAHTISKLITTRGVDTDVPDIQENFTYPELNQDLGF